MEVILKISYQFFGLMFWTIFPFLLLVKIKETGKGFSKLISGIAFISGVIYLLFAQSTVVNASINYQIALPAIALLGLSYFFLSESNRATNLVITFCFLALGMMHYLVIADNLFSFFFWVTKYLVFGVMTFAMILGHYYLVVPRLSEKPLLHSHYISWVGLLVSLIICAFGYSQMNLDFSFINLSELIFLLMRVLWGYVAVAILSIFSYKLSKMRSTQSATGVLYVIVFFLIVGELMSMYFFTKSGSLL